MERGEAEKSSFFTALFLISFSAIYEVVDEAILLSTFFKIA
jgi:hypothetical protein